LSMTMTSVGRASRRASGPGAKPMDTGAASEEGSHEPALGRTAISNQPLRGAKKKTRRRCRLFANPGR